MHGGPAGRVEGERGHADDQVAVVDQRRPPRARGQRRVPDDGDAARRVVAGVVARTRSARTCLLVVHRVSIAQDGNRPPAPGCAGPAARDDNRARACSLRHRRDRLQPRRRPRARQADDLGGRAVLRGRRRQVPEARPATLLTPEQYQAPHPEPRNAFGASYGEHREFLEFDIDQHAELAACAADHGVVYSTSVWDMPSAKAVVGDGAAVRQGARRPPTSTPSCWSCCAPSSAASSTSRSA